MDSLWTSLRASGLEALAPNLVRLGVKSLVDVRLRSAELIAAGVERWKIEAMRAAVTQQAVTPIDHGRNDLPVPGQLIGCSGCSLAESTPTQLGSLGPGHPGSIHDPARLRTYLAACHAWEVEPWPLSTTNIRAFAASMKQRGYRSSQVYFQTLCSHQQRHLGLEVPPLVRQHIRDSNRSIQRGLGVA